MIDETLAFQLDLFRVDAATRARILPLLTRLEQDLVAQLATSTNLTEWNKRRIQTLIAEARATIARYYADAQGELFDTTTGIGSAVASAAQAALESTVPVGITVALAPEGYLASLASNAIIQGATQAAWWARQEADTAWRFEAAVRSGLVAGETNQQIIARIAGKQGFPGVMEIARNNAAALVQTSVQTVANNARQATFDANRDIIARYRWITALDGHVCERCAARADQAWTVDHEPINHGIAWETPPIHFNDRCVIVAETKTFRELGVDLPEPPKGMRASTDGPVPVSTSFADFLERKGEAYQNEVLGPGRAKLWRDGSITLQDLVNGRGNPLSLAQLRAKYG